MQDETTQLDNKDHFLKYGFFATMGFLIPSLISKGIIWLLISSGSVDSMLSLGFLAALIYVIEAGLCYFVARLLWQYNQFLAIGVFVFAVMKVVSVAGPFLVSGRF